MLYFFVTAGHVYYYFSIKFEITFNIFINQLYNSPILPFFLIIY